MQMPYYVNYFNDNHMDALTTYDKSGECAYFVRIERADGFDLTQGPNSLEIAKMFIIDALVDYMEDEKERNSWRDYIRFNNRIDDMIEFDEFDSIEAKLTIEKSWDEYDIEEMDRYGCLWKWTWETL